MKSISVIGILVNKKQERSAFINNNLIAPSIGNNGGVTTDADGTEGAIGDVVPGCCCCC